MWRVALRAAGHGVQAIARTLEDAGCGPRPEAVWLLVRSGSWGFGARRCASVVMRSFPAELYLDVDDEVVALARRTARSPSRDERAALLRLGITCVHAPSEDEPVALPQEHDVWRQ